MKREFLRFGLATTVFLLVGTMAIGTSTAKDYTVTTASDADCSDSNCTLAAALAEAQGNGQDDTITVAGGIYNVSSTLTYDGTSESFGLQLIGTKGASILDGGGSVTIMELFQLGGNLTVRGLTFRNGNNIGTLTDGPGGLGISTQIISNFTVTLDNNTFSNNEGGTDTGAGGVEIEGSRTVLLRDNLFRGNLSHLEGGGLQIGENTGGSKTFTLERNRFENNTALSHGGGFVGGSADGSIALVMVNNVFDNNSSLAGAGGGMSFIGGSGGTTLTMTNNTFSQNISNATSPSNQIDGARLNLGTGDADIYNNIVWRNLPPASWAFRDQFVLFSTGQVTLVSNIMNEAEVNLVNSTEILTSDPLFVSAATGDLHLQAGSPARNAGSNTAPALPATDFEGNLRINEGTVDIGAFEFFPQPTPNVSVAPTSHAFPDVIVMQSSDPLVVTLSNTGDAALSVTNISLGNTTDFSLNTSGGPNGCGSTAPSIAAGDNCTVSVTFTPQTVSTFNTSLSIASNDPDTPTATVSLSGNGVAGPVPNIGVSPPSIPFGDVVVGDSSTAQVVTISNTGAASLSVSGISLNDTTNFTRDLNGGPNGCGIATPSIAAGDNCTVSVTFTPKSVAAFGASLTVGSNDPDTPSATVSLSGTGTAAPAPNISVPSSLGFGEVVVNDTSSPGVVVIQNVGTLELNVSSIALGTGVDFALDTSGGSRPCGTPPKAIAAHDNCTVAVTFAPLATGALADNLAITSDDADQPSVNVQLSGTGLDNVTPAVTSATDSGTITLDTSGNPGTFFNGVRTLLDTEVNQTGKPADFTFPYGLVTFTVNNVPVGGTITVDITFPAAIPAGSKYYKAGPSGFTVYDNVVFSGNTATLTLTDGGIGDSDSTPGTITDPGGLAVPAPPPPSGGGGGGCAVVDTRTAGGTGALMLLALCALWITTRRRRP